MVQKEVRFIDGSRIYYITSPNGDVRRAVDYAANEGMPPEHVDNAGKYYYLKTLVGFRDIGKLVYSAMIVKGTIYKNLVDFLAERYQVMDVNSSDSSSDYAVMMVNGLTPETITMGVGISVYNKTSLLVLYFPTDEATRASSSYDKEIVIANIKQLLYENGY